MVALGGGERPLVARGRIGIGIGHNVRGGERNRGKRAGGGSGACGESGAYGWMHGWRRLWGKDGHRIGGRGFVIVC